MANYQAISGRPIAEVFRRTARGATCFCLKAGMRLRNFGISTSSSSAGCSLSLPCKHHALVTTLVVCLLFAYENLGVLHDVTAQRFALLDAIRHFDNNGGATANPQAVRALIEPTLAPATWASVLVTHLTSDVLTILALLAMEWRRRTLREISPTP